MSNYIMLISDRKMQINTEFKEITVPDILKKYLPFEGQYAYILNPIASDRKEIIAKQMAPNFYEDTCKWFDEIYFAIQKILNQKNKVALIETYYDQKLDEVIWDFEPFPIEKLKEDEVSFEFDTIYDFTI
ncbi:MAG: hypothetical protein IJ458_00175 [Clostridia bacterium]|nr:hypothetical protein [Clostridia bacterium]